MTIHRWAVFALAICSITARTALSDEPSSRLTTRNVVLVTMDGLRWQEVFQGAENALINKSDGGVVDVESLRRDYWRDSPEARREALLPFLWSVIGRQGQIFGNADKGSLAKVVNGRNFSYPGYNEMLSGAPDARIDSNDKRLNPNVTVLEWLERKPGYQGKVAAFGSWDVFPYILNRERSGVRINAGWEPIAGESLSDRQILLNRLQTQVNRRWESCRDDALTFSAALAHLRQDAPRVLYIALGDTDEHAHEGRYDLYLKAAHDSDANLKLLWTELQAHPKYRDATTLIISTDHGRGDPPRDWRSHGAKVKGSEAIWIAILGPDTSPLGERTDVPLVTQSQTAATLAAFLGEDFAASASGIAGPIPDVVGSNQPPSEDAAKKPIR